MVWDKDYNLHNMKNSLKQLYKYWIISCKKRQNEWNPEECPWILLDFCCTYLDWMQLWTWKEVKAKHKKYSFLNSAQSKSKISTWGCKNQHRVIFGVEIIFRERQMRWSTNVSLEDLCNKRAREDSRKGLLLCGPKKPVEGSGGVSNAIYSKNTIVFTMAMKYRFYVYKFSKLLKVKPQSFYRLFTEDFTQKISWKVSWKYAARTFGFYACHAS